MAIEKITNEKREAIKRKSAYALPDRPSDEGLSPERIKKAFYVFVTDGDDSVISEINRIVGEMNGELVAQGEWNENITDMLAKKVNSVKDSKSGKMTAVYVNDTAGNDTYIPATVGEEEVQGESIIKRSSDGIACIGDPYSPNHIANKAYVDKMAGGKIDRVVSDGKRLVYTAEPDGSQGTLKVFIGNETSIGNYNIVQRDGNGRIYINKPTLKAHGANKEYVDDKFANPISSGQLTHDGDATVTGDVIMRNQTVRGNSLVQADAIVRGNLTVLGTTVTEEQETLSVKDAYIITNSDSTDISATMSGTVILTGEIYADGDPYAYGILYDPATDAVRLGHGWYSIDEKKFYFSYDEHLPVAVRSESTKMVNGNFPKWNSATNSFEDSGYNDDDFVPQSSGSRLEEGQSTVFVVSRNEDGVIYRAWTDVTEIDIVNESALDAMLEEVYA